MAVLSPGSSTALSQITRSNGILLLDQSAAPSHWPKIFCYMLTYRLISKHFPSQKSSSAHLRVLTYESEYTVEAPLSSNHFTAGLRINCWRTGSEDFSFSWLAEHWSKHQTLSDAHLNLGPDPSICFFFCLSFNISWSYNTMKSNPRCKHSSSQPVELVFWGILLQWPPGMWEDCGVSLLITK